MNHVAKRQDDPLVNQRRLISVMKLLENLEDNSVICIPLKRGVLGCEGVADQKALSSIML